MALVGAADFLEVGRLGQLQVMLAPTVCRVATELLAILVLALHQVIHRTL
jgi:hypothetical protein